MSRLEEHKKKQFTVTVTSLVMGLIILIVFLFTFGFRLLLGVSSFIANITSKKVTERPLTKLDNVIGDVDIESIPSATNSARIIVTGSVVNFEVLHFFINNKKSKEVELLNADLFEEEMGDLNKGENEVYVLAMTRDSSKKKKTKTFKVFYKSEKPRIEIQEPADGSKTNKSEVSLVGTTDKETYVKVNDTPVVVDVSGKFQTLVRLKDGENKISIAAQDIAGNIEKKTITVTYDKDL